MRSTPSSRGAQRLARLGAAVGATALLTAGCDARELADKTLSFGWPDPVTDRGRIMHDLWLGSTAAALVVGVFVWALILWAAIRYRKNSDDLPRQVRYNLPIEVLYTVIPFVVVAVLFYYTVIADNKVNELSEDPDVTVGVVGFQWGWQFNYANEKVQVTGNTVDLPTLVLPVDRDIRFVETSPDVIHSFWVPQFLFKRDVIPGRVNQFELRPTQTGRYIGRCAELCGEKHALMHFYVEVVEQDAYDAFIRRLQAQGDEARFNGDVFEDPSVGRARRAEEAARDAREDADEGTSSTTEGSH